MSSQDLVFGVGNWLFALALLPTIHKNHSQGRCMIPFKTSAMTAVVLSVYVVAFASMGMWWSVLSSLASGVCWWVIMAQRLYYEPWEDWVLYSVNDFLGWWFKARTRSPLK